MNNILNELHEMTAKLKARAINIIREAIVNEPSHQYLWTIVRGRRLIFECDSIWDENSKIEVWHGMKEGQREFVELSPEEWIEAASKWQRRCVAFIKYYLLLNDKVISWIDIERGEEYKKTRRLDFKDNLCSLHLEEGEEYKLTMKSVEQVMTVAEAEVRRFHQLLVSNNYDLESAEKAFVEQGRDTGLKDSWFMIEELD